MAGSSAAKCFQASLQSGSGANLAFWPAKEKSNKQIPIVPVRKDSLNLISESDSPEHEVGFSTTQVAKSPTNFSAPTQEMNFVQFTVWYRSQFPDSSMPTPSEVQTAWRESNPASSFAKSLIDNSASSIVNPPPSPGRQSQRPVRSNSTIQENTPKKTVEKVVSKPASNKSAKNFDEWLQNNDLSNTDDLQIAAEPLAKLHRSYQKYINLKQELEKLKIDFERLDKEAVDKDIKLERAREKIMKIESVSAFQSGVFDDMDEAIESAIQDWPLAVKEYKFDIFISYRVKSEAQLANELYLYLQLGKHKGRVFLDQHLLQDGEDWRKGFLDGLKQSKLIVMLVSAPAVEGMKRSNLWLDNLLLEWETGLLASANGNKCAVLPVFIGQKNGTPFDFSALKNALNAKIYPKDRPDIEEVTQCYLSAATTLNLLLDTKGVLLKGRSEIKSLVTCISEKIDVFMKNDKSSFSKAEKLFQNLPKVDTEWKGRTCKIANFSENDLHQFLVDVLPYNAFWEEIEIE
ncbi:hypothetical protein HK096_006150, partial [Nowakowskiella sp. JEL0078]